MKSVRLLLIVLAACTVNFKEICCFRIDNMDEAEDRIDLKDPSWPEFSSGILKSHIGLSYRTNNNKTVILSAPPGYSIFSDVRLLDVRPNRQDSLTLFAKQTAGPVTYWNSFSYQHKIFDATENQNKFYAPDGQLGVTFYTSPGTAVGYSGFELIYTVQANWSRCEYNHFRCSNLRCISREFKCDGHNHCGDRSDQRNCFSPDPVRPRSGRVAGIVGGVVFFLIAVACAIYIMIRRAQRIKTETRTAVNTHQPPPNIQGYPPPYPEPNMTYPPPPPPYSPYQGVTNPGFK